MELHHLRYFVAVAEDLSFTRAARRLKMAQPPLSRQIRSLENEIGVQLFERRSGKVFLTDAGCRFLSGVRVALEQVELAVDVARQTMHGELGTVRVGFGKGLGDVVSLAINQHMRLFPKSKWTSATFFPAIKARRCFRGKLTWDSRTARRFRWTSPPRNCSRKVFRWSSRAPVRWPNERACA